MSYNFKNLVFEGGGVKGIAYGGALDILDSMNILKGIQRVAGTSAGAINATLLALGYSSKDVSAIVAATNFNNFKDDGFIVGDIKRLVDHYGWYKGDAFKEWIGKYIKDKTGKAETTFREMAAQAQAKSFRSLYMIASNLSMQRADVFSAEHTPDVPVRDAVRMSMSIPLYFQSVQRGKDVIVDGGVSWNYPVNLFDYKKYLSKPINGLSAVDYATDPDYVFNYETLGFRLDSKSVIEYASHNWASEPMQISSMKDYAAALVNFMMEMANKSHLHENDWNRTVFIDTLDVKTTDFDLPQQKITALIKSGNCCTTDYFKWRDSDKLWSRFPQ